MNNDPMHVFLPYLPLVIVAIILFRRTRRPRVIRPGQLWISPAILIIALGFYVYGAMLRGPQLHPLDWLVMLGTAAVGAALGAVRAHSVRLKRHPESGAIEATLSAWGLIIILAWIGSRMLLKQSGWVGASEPFGIYTDASMSLALGVVVAQAIVLSRRCQAVVAEYNQSSDRLPEARSEPGG
jgi:uncharacterized membrane protein